MKKFSGLGLVVVLLVALVALPAMAKIDKAPVGKGSSEVSANLALANTTFSSDESDATFGMNSFTLGLGYGYFLTNAIQLGVFGSYSMSQMVDNDPNTEEQDPSSQFFYQGRAAYNFQLKNSPAILPFVALKLGGATFISGDPNADPIQAVSYGMGAGLRYFLSRQASLNAEFDYDAMSAEVDAGGGDTITFTIATTQVWVGLSVFLGGAK